MSSREPDLYTTMQVACTHDWEYTDEITFDFEPNNEVARPVIKCKKCDEVSNGFIPSSTT